MKTYHTDTIAAIATGQGRAGIGVIRISGPRSLHICQQIAAQTPTPRYAHYATFKDQQQLQIDQGVVLYFKAPHSFTGEDVIELQGHGGKVVLEQLLNTVIQNGARIAKPGEFSERAFLNNKIDLVQAESIVDLIEASSIEAVQAANRSLQGAFSKQINELRDALIELRVYVESSIDFPEEEIDFLTEGQVDKKTQQLLTQAQHLRDSAAQGQMLRDGAKIVISGKPNAGKSSLINQLAKSQVAIVTDVPGTTRDVLKQTIFIGGIATQFIDTAGIRESEDVVEQEGIRRAKEQIQQADHLIIIEDITDTSSQRQSFFDELTQLSQTTKITIVENKIDAINQAPQITYNGNTTTIKLSAKTGQGLELLQQHIYHSLMGEHHQDSLFSARRRHLLALDKVIEYITIGYDQIVNAHAGELLSEELRHAQDALSEITGEFSADDLLGEIFSSFCIGK